jgi:hypothetical protein
LSLRGNKVCNEVEYEKKVKTLIPSLRILDNVRFDERFLKNKRKRVVMQRKAMGKSMEDMGKSESGNQLAEKPRNEVKRIRRTEPPFALGIMQERGWELPKGSNEKDAENSQPKKVNHVKEDTIANPAEPQPKGTEDISNAELNRKSTKFKVIPVKHNAVRVKDCESAEKMLEMLEVDAFSTSLCGWD